MKKFKTCKQNAGDSERRDLLMEADLLNSCAHINLIKFYGVCLKNKKLEYIVMEYMNRKDLLTFLKNSKDLSIKIAIEIAIEIANGCNYLESQNMVHRFIIFSIYCY